MLRLHPDKRAKAADLVHHNWMDGVLVQGEIDVIRRAEEDEARRRRREGAGVDALGGDMSPNSKLKAALDQSEADAMKPVDDITVLSDTDKLGPSPPPPPSNAYHPPKLSNAPVPSSSSAKENAKTRPTSSGSAAAPAAGNPPRSRPNSSAKSTSSSAKR
jgi:serine/threonine-protein kinase SRPK3